MSDIIFVKQYANGHEDGYIAVVKCPFCGAFSRVRISTAGLFRWNQGALVQDAFPNLSADDREILISGICRKCQEGVFGGGDE